ncbi:unnamed protein product [Paramecium pentaurelia]|uniref:methylcrotonoyl-CoA carboxylase n=1 Tax=Paramecium pentaurelia TaxID=43138 RepID=A0A8S1U8N0_9CILI|nr:unnamed protein product [Paramecium pentaurelia]
MIILNKIIKMMHYRSLFRFSHYPVLQSLCDRADPNLQANFELMKQSNERFLNITNKVINYGGTVAHQKLAERNKFPVRERITRLLDVGSPFLELSQLAGYELYDKEEVPSGGIVTGIGLINKRFCMIVANDPTIKGGTYYPITVKKHVRAQEIAWENKLPCVYLVDSGGANLMRQDEVFPDRDHFGRIFYNQANMSAQGIPQISIVLGSCTAGGAYVPAMSDENVIVSGNGTIFLGGPPLVKAATGEVVTAEDLGGARVHCFTSGLTDHFCTSELEALQKGRSIIRNLTTKQVGDIRDDQPIYDIEDLNYLMSSDLKKSMDSRHLIARILDGSRFMEFKENYGTTLITGFGELYGQEVGIIANNGILFSESALKGAHFVSLCQQRGVPLIFLQNITGFMVGRKYETEGIAKHGAKMVNAVATATVPKLTLLFGGSFGAGNYGMCGRAYGAKFLFSWPSSRISVMGGDQAAGVLTSVQQQTIVRNGGEWNEKVEKDLKQKYSQKYDNESSAYYATARLWDDGIILPTQTRQTLGLALLTSMQHYKYERTGHGVFRM